MDLPARPRTLNAFEAHYRVPSGLIDIVAQGGLSPEPAYFNFQGATCYGRSVALPPTSHDGGPIDLSNHVRCDNGVVRLPFDLTDVVENAHLERYQARPLLSEGGLLRSMYYLVRPALPVHVRKHLQRLWLRDWSDISFPRWPVDFTVETLMEQSMSLAVKASGLSRVPFIWFWPEGAPSCAMMTHDVESKAGIDFCDQLMDVDESFGIKASFQLVPEVRYDVTESFFEHVRRRGFEANIHDLNHDGQLFQDHKRFRERAIRINAYGKGFKSRGFRSGAMYRRQEWFDALDFSYDMSVPNVAHLEPQRGGCCTVTPYFVGKILELPLTTIQDYSLFHILCDYSTEMWRKQIALITARHGLISFITHPDYLIEDRARHVYMELLSHLKQLRDAGTVWTALPGEVDRWWRNRSAMTLVPVGRGDWRIEGPDSDRARIAYATLENDRLVYRVAHASEEVEYSPC